MILIVEENNLNSPAFAKAALDSVSANICIIDKTGIILAVNQRWRDFFQENSEELESQSIGINYLDICNSASGSRSEEALPMYEGIMSVIQGYQSEFTFEYPCHSPTELRWFRARVTKFRDGSGNIVIAHELITERKIAEDALRISEARMKAILNNVAKSFLFIDIKGKVQFFNQLAFERARDIFEIEIHVGDLLIEKINPKHRNFFADNFNLALSGEKIAIETPFYLNNAPHWFEINYIPIYQDKSNVIGVLFTTTDINKYKVAEKELIEQADHLTELNAMKDKFFNIIAHDLRNPFAGILGITEILQDKVKDSNQSEDILKIAKLIRDSSVSAANLLENLLEWAKSQTGSIRFNPEPILIDTLIETSLQVVQSSAYKKKITIKKEIEYSVPVFADRSLSDTILRNLIGNAIKFSYIESSIHIKTKKKGEFLEISIEDSGTGIKEENLNKLFRIESKFSQLGTEKEKGTGLGLILCKEFVERQGGTLQVKSILGKGSTFSFTIPIALTEPQKVDP